MNNKNLIAQWMKQTKSLSFFLPNGPYGRPFDNQYFFQGVEEDGHSLIINLSGGIALAFVGDSKITTEDEKLLISGFDKFDFIIESKINKSFVSGEVCLYRF